MLANDERYEGAKMALHDNYLLGKKDYPSDVLGGKHILVDYKGAPSRNKKSQRLRTNKVWRLRRAES